MKDIANVTFRSVLGTIFQWYSWTPIRPRNPGEVDGNQVHQVHHEHEDKMVRARGAKKLRSPGNTSFTVLSMNSNTISMNPWKRPGTPDVTRCAANQKIPRPTTPRITDIKSESTFTCQKPPSAIGFVRLVKWWEMYPDGVRFSKPP